VTTLQGRTIVVTRAIHQAAPLVDALEQRGARVLAISTIAIAPVDDVDHIDATLGELKSFDWIVFTSANAVDATFARLSTLGKVLPSGLGVAAVGPSTAQALIDRGVTAPHLPMTFGGEQLAAALPSLAGKRVLMPRGDIARAATLRAFEEAGASVVPLTVYRNVPCEMSAGDRAALAGTIDAITFTSPSTARGLADALGPDVHALLRRTVAACIGPTTAAALQAFGIANPLVSREATTASLVAALEERFA
jgi:uroporphyrinogen-III synthase